MMLSNLIRGDSCYEQMLNHNDCSAKLSVSERNAGMGIRTRVGGQPFVCGCHVVVWEQPHRFYLES